MYVRACVRTRGHVWVISGGVGPNSADGTRGSRSRVRAVRKLSHPARLYFMRMVCYGSRRVRVCGPSLTLSRLFVLASRHR